MIDRRAFLARSTLAGAAFLVPRIAFAAAATERRFVFVIQRGAADGLETVVPVGDPAYADLRGAIALDPAKTTTLDAMFGLHPSLVQAGQMYHEGSALFLHATASAYRDRSHFDGQNVLETGGNAPYAVRDGWLNRLAALLPGGGDQAIAIAPAIPAALRGMASVSSYAPSALPEPSDDLLASVTRLYAEDPQLHPLWSAALDARAIAGETPAGRNPAAIGKLTADFLTRPDGPRLAMIETTGWDTHSQQNARLARQLGTLDAMLGALRTGMGPAWKDTVVLVATEFGRTAAVNGTGGTDHGTASAAMLLGGAVKGGRVLADWPGLRTAQLYEGRDLKPTVSIDDVIAQASAECFGLDPARTGKALFGAPPRFVSPNGLVKGRG